MRFVPFLPKYLLSLAIIVSFVLLDYNIKMLIISLDQIGKLPEIICQSFNIIFVYNYGISFGMFSNITNNQVFIIIPVLLIIAIISYLIVKAKNKLAVWLYSLIIAGAIGNLIDRIKYGAVVDYLDFHLWGYHYPAFNLADTLIVVAAITLLFKPDAK